MKKIKTNLGYVSVLFFLLALVSYAYATTINYTLDNNGGGNYTYHYTLDNTAGPDIQGFGVDFDVSLYNEATLTLGANPVDWDGLILGSIPFVAPASADWFFTLPSAFATGGSASGFSVSFDWLGAAAGPGSQDFYTYDANFGFIDFGTTILGSTEPGPAVVPEPNILVLLGLGLLGLVFTRRLKQG